MTGISRVAATYYPENGGCAVKISVDWKVESGGNHAICLCYVLSGDYVCFEVGNRFVAADGESGTFEFYGMDSPEYVAGYDFYYTAGEKVDVSILIDPFEPPSSIVGIQKGLTWDTCSYTYCTPGDRICKENDIYECNVSGTAYDNFIESCPAGCTDGVCDEVLSLDALTCKGFQEDCSPFRVEEIFGKTLYKEDLYPDICDWFTYACDFNCGFRSWNPTTSFDLSSLTRNEHEVGVTYVTMGGLATNGRYHVLAKWYDPNNDYLFTNNSGYFTGLSAYRWLCWIGYCDWEISINGEYKVIVELFEDDRLIMVKTIYFDITGISCPVPTCKFAVLWE